MVDANSTTVEWQHAGDLCVLPVGSFEQHSAHMPLDTDSIEAEFFARMLAEDLEAALLPAIRFASSLEHTGFRGSISLRPETLMQIIRDLADEVESQGFRILLIANFHGGNHFLVPVCRHINRSDRPLKILLVNPYDHCDPTLAKDSQEAGHDLHSGEWETSIMLALRPELVREERIDMVPQKGEPYPLKQADLTTFGVGHFSPGGAFGFPSYATAEKGKQIIESIRENMLPFVRDRVGRLRNCRDYSGL